MIDIGCLCFAVFNENLERTQWLHRIEILPRLLRLTDGTIAAQTNHIISVDVDDDGRQEKIWGYEMSSLANSIILGKPWIENNDMVYLARRHCLRIGSRKEGIIVRASGWCEYHAPFEIQSRVSHVIYVNSKVSSYIAFARFLGQNKAPSNITLEALSMHDINQALKWKRLVSRKEVRDNFPREIHQFTDLFLDDKVKSDNTLPSFYPSIDSRLNFKKYEQGRDKEIPWGPLYGISREKLLVLRKTLTELLYKNWIRASSSLGGAPVLLIKRPGSELRFCVDYHALNAITGRDRYPLPLIGETLRMVSCAKWLTKLDFRSTIYRLRIAYGDEWKTTFRTRFGAYEWLVTLFVLVGAPAAYQI